MSQVSQQTNIRVGPAGWSYPDWKGTVYPLKKPRGFNELEYISTCFDAVEVNVSYYRPVSPGMAESWVKKVSGNPRFKFSVKLWNRFTHNRSELNAGDTNIFRAGIQPLSDNGLLGCLLMQFPWSFKYSHPNFQWVQKVVDQFREFPVVLEIRHDSWLSQTVLESLREQEIGFCNIDQPVFSGSLKPTTITTSTTGYVRLHGRNYTDWFREDAGRDARYNYLYPEHELAEWVNRIKTIDASSSQTFVVLNNHFRGQAVCNAFQIKYLLENRNQPVPESLLKHFSILKKIARSLSGQIELFDT